MQKTGGVVEERKYQEGSANYDYSKFFNGQVDDWINGRMEYTSTATTWYLYKEEIMQSGHCSQMLEKMKTADKPLYIMWNKKEAYRS